MSCEGAFSRAEIFRVCNGWEGVFLIQVAAIKFFQYLSNQFVMEPLANR